MHAADTSLSVETAVDVAREAADFVLLERNLDVIRGGIEEGRRTFANTLKYILTTTSANLGNMVVHGSARCSDGRYTLLAGRENPWIRSLVFRHPGSSVCNHRSVRCRNRDLKGMVLSKHAPALGVNERHAACLRAPGDSYG